MSRLIITAGVVAAAPFSVSAPQDARPAIRLDTVHFAPALAVDLTRAAPTLSVAYVRDLAAGKGRRADRGDTVTVRWRAWSPDGLAVGGDTAHVFTFRAGAGLAMPGLDQGVQGMLVGGRRQVVVPAGAQGPCGVTGVPRAAPVVFALELVAAR